MPLDYRERRPIKKNRPKNRPVKFVILVSAGIALGIYSLGVATGWFLSKATKTSHSSVTVTAADAKPKANDAPSNGQPQQQGNNAKSSDPPLTFYYTLPKGGKTALGSGMNPPRTDVRSLAEVKPAEPARTRPAHSQGEQYGSIPAGGQRANSLGSTLTATKSADTAGKKNVTDNGNPGKGAIVVPE